MLKLTQITRLESSQRALVAAFACSLGLSSLPAIPALANGSSAGEFAKYLNPVHKKSDLNKSQDRIIKKSKFKSTDATGSSGSFASNSELGLFASIPATRLTDTDYLSKLLNDKRINGLSATIPWSLVEPQENKDNWQPIDQLLGLCQSAGKTLILRISTAGVDLAGTDDVKSVAADTPNWVLDKDTKSVTFASADGKQHKMPVFWDKSYLAKWSNFVQDLAEKYDNNPYIHSIGITGGGFQGGTAVLPGYEATVPNESGTGQPLNLEKSLQTSYGMSQRQLVEHWKYVADVFPKYFKNTRLNFAINPPLPHRSGEDALDEISDYLIFRYGQRIYITRAGIETAKHGFDDYRILLKLHNDTLTGIALAPNFKPDDMAKIAKHALDDGISFAEIPPSLLDSQDTAVESALDSLSRHMGFKLATTKASIQETVAAGEPIKTGFTFVNSGAATAMRPERNFDKDIPSSFRLQIELRDAEGKPVLKNVHTPPTPTNKWSAGKPVVWEEELKTIDTNKHQLPPGEYTAWMSIIDASGQRKLSFIDATGGTTNLTATTALEVGKVHITDGKPGQKDPVQPRLEASSPAKPFPEQH